MEYAPAAVALAAPTSIEIIERKSLRTALNATTIYNNSTIYQIAALEPLNFRLQHLREGAIQRYTRIQQSSLPLYQKIHSKEEKFRSVIR